MCRYIYKWEFNFWEGDCPMMMSSNNQPLLPHDTEDVIFLEGHFFIKKKAIQKNKQVVQKTFSDLYKYISDNYLLDMLRRINKNLWPWS